MCFGLVSFVSPASTLADTDLTLGGDAVVAYAQGDNVRVRDGASYGSSVVTSVPEGGTVSVIDGPFADDDGNFWYQVSANGATGYMVSDYLANSGAIYTSSSGNATATDNVFLRTGPGLGYSSVGKIPAGDAVTIVGDNMDGWLRVSWNGYDGWAYGAFFTGSGAPDVPVEEPVADQAPEPQVEWIDAGTRYTNDSVNLRSEPSMDSTVYEVLPAGVAVDLTGKSVDGFAEGTANGTAGWVSLEYLSWEAPAAPEPEAAPEQGLTEEPEEEVTEEEAAPAPSGSSIVWPMSGGEWYIGQGYNGSSHTNSGGLWQYQYSLDLARTDENTGGEATYSPVNGTVRWLDPSTGGISIDIGGGLAVALFHVDIDPSIAAGDAVSQGQYIGTVSYPGGGGNGGWSHIHMTVWATSDGGNWDRQAIPFEGATAISGQSFPSSGVSQDWTGTIINP
jgi:uncharacterized protein YgiM (DUF1202 family)